jgi:hypothetical protein
LSSRQSGLDGRSMASRLRMIQEPKLRVFASQFAGEVERVVRRAIIHDDDFKAARQIREHVEQMMHLLNERRFRVANGNNDAERIGHVKRALGRNGGAVGLAP